MRITGFPAGAFQTNCYVVAADGGDECVIVDPGQDSSDKLRQIISRAGLRPKAVLLTHGHLDHVWNLREVCERYGIPAYVHPDDRHMLRDPAAAVGPGLAAFVGDLGSVEPDEVIELFDGDTVRIAGLEFDVDHVPGHSPGSVTFRATAETDTGPVTVVIGGDVLFQGSIGRTDLPGGDHDQLLDSIAKKLLTLDDSAVVLPGHGPDTTVGAERRSNPFLRGLG